MAAIAPRLAAQTHDRLGESAMWHSGEQAFYWIDWYGPVLHRMRGGGAVESWTIPGTSVVGSFVFVSGGRMMLAIDSGLTLFDLETGQVSPFADPNAGRENVSYNDSKLDRAGRLWVGTFDLTETEPRGILYCIDRYAQTTVADSGFAVCNGPAFSPDGRVLYFSDTLGKRILAYDVSPDSPRLLNRRNFASMSPEEGIPDGLTVDAEGCLWCAHYGAGRVTRYAPDGAVKATFELPCPSVTSMSFGGPHMTTLFVTTGWSAGVQSVEDEPGPGGTLFAFETGIRGLPEPEFEIGRD